MSTKATVPPPDVPPLEARRRVTLPYLVEMKRTGQPIVMVTAYDFPSAVVVDRAGVDVVLVGDSAAMTVLGYASTVPASAAEMLMLAAAVRRGLRSPFMVGDLPFGTYEESDAQAVATAIRFVKEAGCDAVKIEGGGETPVARARAIVQAGIPVMGHVGLTPQTSVALGGYRAQGRDSAAAERIACEALALQRAGCFSIVFEAIPSAVAAEIMPLLQAIAIGIGAGPSTDGQVLVFHDLLGIRDGVGARFVKRYASMQDQMIAGVSAYVADVRGRIYPATEHGYSISPQEITALRQSLAKSM